MKLKFASLAHPETRGYAYDTEHYGYSAAAVDPHFRSFPTYGDGLTQHGGDSPITVEFMADYLASLATVMLDNEALVKDIGEDFTRGPSIDTLEFCASVIFKPQSDEMQWEKKTRYYSVELKQISSTESKRHDNRFTKLEKWNDGTAGAIFYMLARDHDTGMDRYRRAHVMHEWVRDQCAERSNAFPKVYMDLPAVFLNWFKDADGPADRARQLRDAYDACAALAKAARQRAHAKGNLRNYLLSIGKPFEEEAA